MVLSNVLKETEDDRGDAPFCSSFGFVPLALTVLGNIYRYGFGIGAAGCYTVLFCFERLRDCRVARGGVAIGMTHWSGNVIGVSTVGMLLQVCC